MPPSDRPGARTAPEHRGAQHTAIRAGIVRLALGAVGLISCVYMPNLARHTYAFVGYMALAAFFQIAIQRRMSHSVSRVLMMGVVDMGFLSFLVQQLGSVTNILPMVYVAVPVLYATTTPRRRISLTLAGVGVGLYALMIVLELSGVIAYGPSSTAGSMPSAPTMLISLVLVSVCTFVTATLTTQLIAALGRANGRLRDLSQHDELTGLYNRRFVMQRLGEELARVKRHSGQLTVAMVDLDGFKRVNDEEGHDAGDAVLCAVADALLRATRKTDVVSRWGGDEFLVLLPNTGPGGIEPVGERMLDLARRAAQAISPGIAVTASIGTATAGADDEAAEVVRRADEQLYAAKRAGGDRLLQHADPRGSPP